MSYSTVTLTGTYKLPNGIPAKGTVEIIPSEPLILDDAGNVVLSGRAKAKLEERTWPKVDPDTGEPVLDADGNPVLERGGWFSVALPATDDPRLTPTGFGYTLAARLHHTHLPAISFSLPAATATVDVTDVTQVDPSTFTPDANYVTDAELATALEGVVPDTTAIEADVTALDTRVTTVEGEVAGKLDTTDADAEVAGFVGNQWSATAQAIAAGYAPRHLFMPGNSGGSRRWVRLLTIDGGTPTQGGYANFILSGTGDFGGARRGTLLAHASQRGDNTFNVDVWSWGVPATSDPIEIHSKQVSTYVFEVWAKVADWNQAHSFLLLASERATIQLDSATTTAPAGARHWAPAAPDASKAVTDTYTLRSLDRANESAARRAGGKALIEYADATELTEDWADLTAPVVPATNAQVSANRLYAVGTANPGGIILPFPVAANETAHIEALLYWKAGGSGNPLYFGVDAGAVGHAPVASSPDGLFLGFNGSGGRSSFKGGSMPSLSSAANIGTSPTTDTTYVISVDIDAVHVSFSLRQLGSDSVMSTAYATRASLATAGKAINNIAVFVQDSRGTGGHGIGPIIATKSLQQPRTKTVAGQTSGGTEGRHIITAPADASDTWRVALPPTYDARKPHPLVLWAHQSLSGTLSTAWSETRSQPLVAALSDAGYIVAAPNDGGDRWGNATSLANYRALYEYVRDNFNTGPVFMIGASMGMLPVLNTLTHREFPTPAAVASIGGVADLDKLWAQSAYDDGIATAYGISGPDAPDSEYETKTAGYNPIDRAGWEFRGVPMRLYSGTTDTVVPTADHATALAAKVAPYSPDVAVVEIAGAHLATGHYVADLDTDGIYDLLEFFNAYR